ncbi:FG-GAP repeat protein, partial [candidate division KSB1 bacterium]|nr:FG-GAP repeat protein [candidate division KSB1 bacterium]
MWNSPFFCRGEKRVFGILFCLIGLASSVGRADETKLTASDGAVDDYFGQSVAISGEFALVGAPFDDVGDFANAGAVYVFRLQSGVWNQIDKWAPAGTGDLFGFSVALSGNRAVVGAKGDFEGSAFVYVWNGTAWSLQQQLTAIDGFSGDEFGYAVDIFGDYIIVGASRDDVGVTDAGSAYIFYHNGSSWVEQAKLTADTQAANDFFGESVAIDGTTAVVGAIQKDGKIGAAYVFVRSGSSWSLQQKLTASDGATREYFGKSVDIEGSQILVGAWEADAPGTNSGAAYLFQNSGGSWSQQKKLVANDGTDDDRFGTSVRLIGGFAVVGARGVSGSTGAVYTFAGSGNTWEQRTKVTASDGAANDWFGVSVSTDGVHALVGALFDDDNGSDSGSAYLYDFVQDLSLPVQLASFRAQAEPGAIVLSWRTESEIDNLGFHVRRATNESALFEQLTIERIPGAGTSTEAHDYSFRDRDIVPEQIYYYFIEAIDIAGRRQQSEILAVQALANGSVPETLTLHPLYPNPFNGGTAISFELAEPGR